MLKNTKNVQCRPECGDAECTQGNIIKLCYVAMSSEHNILSATHQMVQNYLHKWLDGNNLLQRQRGIIAHSAHGLVYITYSWFIYWCFQSEAIITNSHCVNCGMKPWIMKGKNANKLAMAQLKIPAWNVPGLNKKKMK